MKLTGKCNENFSKWISENHNKEIIHREGGDWGHGYEIDLSIDDVFDELPEVLQNALIIEFFDSAEMYIKIYPHLGGGEAVFYPSFCFRDKNSHDNERNATDDVGELFYSLTRLEAQNEIIKFTNDIYNLKHQ